MNTILSGMPSSWAKQMGMKAYRQHYNINNRFNPKDWDNTRFALINFVDDPKKLNASSTSSYSGKLKQAFSNLSNAGVSFAAFIENEPGNMKGYSPANYIDQLAYTQMVADGFGVEVYHGGHMMHQTSIWWAEDIVKPTMNAKDYKAFLAGMRAAGIKGSSKTADYIRQERFYIDAWKLPVKGCFHYQEAAEYLPGIASYYASVWGEDSALNELAARTLNPDNIRALLTSVCGILKHVTWYDTLPGDGYNAVKLDKACEAVVKEFI